AINMGHAPVPGPAAGASTAGVPVAGVPVAGVPPSGVPPAGWAGAVTDSRIPPPGASLDAGAIAALFRDHHAELVRLALLMVGDLPSAEDVVEDVYASLHRMSRNTNHSESP